jgi:tight adherence protein C
VTLGSSAAGLAAALAAAGVAELVSLPRRSKRWRPVPHLAAVLRRLRVPRRLATPQALRAKVLAAGEPAGLGVREWVAAKLCCAGTAGGCALLALPGAPGRTGILALVVGPVAALRLPDLWLARAAAVRVESARRHLPDLIDMLRVTVTAGAAPMRALDAVARQFPGPLASELREVVTVCGLGERPASALERLEQRLPCDDVASFARVLRDSSRHGTPLAPALAAQAARTRHRRRQDIRERAARAGPKIQLVVSLVLVPSVLLVIAAALVAELPRAGLGAGF